MALTSKFSPNEGTPSNTLESDPAPITPGILLVPWANCDLSRHVILLSLIIIRKPYVVAWGWVLDTSKNSHVSPRVSVSMK